MSAKGGVKEWETRRREAMRISDMRFGRPDVFVKESGLPG